MANGCHFEKKSKAIYGHPPKLSSQQHVKHGSNLMNIFHNFVSIFWGLGKRMLNQEVLMCHEDLIAGITMDNKFFICENINIYGYLGAGGGGGHQ